MYGLHGNSKDSQGHAEVCTYLKIFRYAVQCVLFARGLRHEKNLTPAKTSLQWLLVVEPSKVIFLK